MLPDQPKRGDDGGHSLVTARPAAVAFTDIVGYSILMTTEEWRTHARWMAPLRTMMRPITTVHRGRVVDLRGDGVLADFATAADALRWALDLQRAMLEHNRPGAETPHIVLRIGPHVGEVLAQDRTIFGDAVNIAARLQEQAQPSGIALSQPMPDQAAGTMKTAVATARGLGLLELKNIARPIRSHAIDTHVQRVALPLPRPSIAVLSLHILGGDPADGVVEGRRAGCRARRAGSGAGPSGRAAVSSARSDGRRDRPGRARRAGPRRSSPP
ncbi:adenylate/guanylate cyclase domain-containing protein [Dankookia sp. GCM10030260]|uniref:adenylate/guanylate cyclase domain-containing protein n=1 Tax=Dankookia sp. GCM10030260 TaxID=3273390 RepID=UPI0036109C48